MRNKSHRQPHGCGMKKIVVCVYRGIPVGPAAFPGDGCYAGGRRGRSVVGVELGRMSGESSLQQVSQVIDTVIRRGGRA